MPAQWNQVDLGGKLDDNSRIWRYIDYPKFLHLLETTSLYCARLSRMPDLFEGHLPLRAARAESEASSAVVGLGRVGKMRLGTTVDDNRARLRREAEELRERTYVSCWHIASVETDALWRMYAHSGNGVAIASTARRLMDAVTADRDISIGRVHYSHFDDDSENHPGLGNAFRKREAFRHDEELRLAIQLSAGDDFRADHVLVPVDLVVLLERVRLAPGTAAPVKDAVANLLSRYGLDGGLVEGSILDKRPSY